MILRPLQIATAFFMFRGCGDLSKLKTYLCTFIWQSDHFWHGVRSIKRTAVQHV
jgi:hypothetical protein